MDTLEKLREQKSQADEALNDAIQARASRQRRVQELQAQRRDADLEAEARILLPHSAGVAVAEAIETDIKAMDVELERLRVAEERAKEEQAAAAVALTEFAVQAIPNLVRSVERATQRQRSGLAHLTKKLLGPVKRVHEAAAERERAAAELRELVSLLPEGKLARRQEHELRAHLKGLSAGGTGPEVLGSFVVRLVTWLRRSSSPAQSYLAEEGLPPIRGSVLVTSPFIDEDIHTARAGRLPL